MKLAEAEGLWCTVRQDVQGTYNSGIKRRMKHMVWSSGCSSWYLSPGGENHSLYSGFASKYFVRTHKFRSSEYKVARKKLTDREA